MKSINLDEKIMERIKNNKVKMRPKILYSAEKTLLAAGLILSVVFSVIFINLTIHIIKGNGTLEFLEFGPEGWSAFIESFPYGFLIWTAILVALAYWAFSQFDFSYKKPSYQFLIVILAVGVSGGLLLSASHANEMLEEPAKKSNIPIVSHAYRSAEPKMLNSGTFVKIDKAYDGYVIAKLPNGKTLIIKTNNELGKNLNNVVVEGSQADSDFANRQISEADREFSQLIATQQTMIAKINKLRQEQLEKLQNMQYKSGQVLKIVGQRNGNIFEAVNIASVNSNPKMFASEEN